MEHVTAVSNGTCICNVISFKSIHRVTCFNQAIHITALSMWHWTTNYRNNHNPCYSTKRKGVWPVLTRIQRKLDGEIEEMKKLKSFIDVAMDTVKTDVNTKMKKKKKKLLDTNIPWLLNLWFSWSAKSSALWLSKIPKLLMCTTLHYNNKHDYILTS